MNAEFDWWLLLVGIVGGAALVWLVVGDLRRRDDDLADDERQLESEWIADAFGAAGRDIDERTVSEVLELHRAYLAGPAPELNPLDETAVTGPAQDGPTADGVQATAPSPEPAEGPPDGAPPTSSRVRETGVSAPAPARGGAQPRQAPGDGS